MPPIVSNATQSTSSALPGWGSLPPEYAIPDSAPSEDEARDYCRRLARTHYENFSVATWFLPKRLQQHFFNVYSYCRISDDLGDEVGDPAASLTLLDQWQSELDACYAGRPKHPVFVALAETVRQFEIPKHEFSDLLIAFRQDQTVTRFETFNDVGPEEPCPPRNGHGPAGPEPAHRSMARWFEPPRDTPAAARSESTIERTNSLNDTRGFHPNFSRAFDASPTRMVGSTGRKYLGSWRTCGSQSSPTYQPV